MADLAGPAGDLRPLHRTQIDALLRKWLARLPHPCTADGYRFDISILQAEFSLTQILDKRASGRVFFEQVIRDNRDAPPEQVSLIFDRHLIRTGPPAI